MLLLFSVITAKQIKIRRDWEVTAVSTSRVEQEVHAAIKAVEREDVSVTDKVEMLMEIAMGLQTQPKSPDDLLSAIELYDRALQLCPDQHDILLARITARKGTALQAIPSPDSSYLEQAETAFEAALKVLNEHGDAEEVAEVEMNLGLVIQTLAGAGRRKLSDAIAAYQRSLRVFNKEAHPKEFAILQNNLATAFMSMPFTDPTGKMREALAVQSFEEGLKVVNLIDHPVEYAMLQNNLGNALQYASSSHIIENNLRALQAYEEALKVRKRKTTPLEYANTISNKANCLLNLPDDPENPELRNRGNQIKAKACYEEALEIFLDHGESAKAEILREAISELKNDIGLPPDKASNGTGAGIAH